jgi:spermidine synthase
VSRTSRATAVVAACLFLSGAGSLVLEVVWTRLLRLVFGSTTLAVSTVLVAYMLGLGLGGLFGGRIAARLRNGVRAYGLMEIGIALYAFAVPSLLALLPQLTGALFAELSFWPAALCRFAIVLVLLLLPTACMGATLPVLVAALVRGDATIARSVGLLYGVNTLGAVCGVFVATFALFPAVGLPGSNALGAILDLVVGLLALLVVAPRFERTLAGGAAAAAAAPAAAPRGAPALRRWNLALLSYGTVGMTALVYEVCWTRALYFVVCS